MKKLLLLFTILSPFLGLGQIQLSGKINDQNSSQFLPGAVVRINDVIGTQSSEKDGTFIFPKLLKGVIHLKVFYLGYSTYETEMDLKKDTFIVIGLTRTTHLNEAVIIKATRADEKSPITVQNIDKKQINELNYGQDIPFLLNNQPSTVVTSDAGTGVGYTGMRIRGSDLTRINVTINGIPLNDPESHLVYFVDMPDFASSVDNIEVQRGVGTSASGVASFGGGINIQTLKCNPKPYSEISATAGTFNTQKYNLSFGTGLLNDHWTIDGRLSKISSDGFIDRGFSNLKSFFISAGYYGKNFLLKINILSGKERTYQAWYGVPQDSLATNRTYNPYTYSDQTDNYQQDHYQIIWSKNLGKYWNLNLAGFFVHGVGYYQEYEENQLFSDYNLPNPIVGNDTLNSTSLIRQRWLDNDFFGGTWSLNYENNKKLKITIGGGWNQYNGRHYGKVVWAENTSTSFPDKDYYTNLGWKNDFNVFGKVLYPLTARLFLFGDVQYRTLTYSFLGYDNFLLNVTQEVKLSFLNPKAGVHYDFDEHNSMNASIGIGNKEPSRDDYVESTPSSRPKPEKLTDIEVGYLSQGKKYSCQATFFYMDYKDQLCLTGKINDVGSYTRVNVPSSYRYGIELNGGFALSQNFSLQANIALSKNIIPDFEEYIDNWDNGLQVMINHKNTELSFSPGIIGGVDASYSIVKKFRITVEEKYVGDQYMDNTTNSDRKLKAFYVSNLRASYYFYPAIVKEIEVSLQVNNILNKKYESNGWTYSYIYGGAPVTENYYYPQAGTHFLAALKIKL